MLKVFSFLKKRSDLSLEQFRDHYETQHAPLICSLAPPPLVYRRNYLDRSDELGLPHGAPIGFDVVTEQVFADEAAFRSWVTELSSPGKGELVREDEARFLDHAHYFAYTVDERSL